MKVVKIIKPITKVEMNKLINKGYIRNTGHGFISNTGELVGFYRCKGVAKTRYIQDEYAVIAKKLEV